MKHDLFEVSQYIIVFDEDRKVLLLNHSAITRISEKWGFPGGHLSYNESPEESLKREVKEETNINIDSILPLKTEVINETYIIFFVAKYSSGKIKLSKEHTDSKWVKIDEMKKLDLIDNSLIDCAKQGLKLIF